MFTGVTGGSTLSTIIALVNSGYIASNNGSAVYVAASNKVTVSNMPSGIIRGIFVSTVSDDTILDIQGRVTVGAGSTKAIDNLGT